MSNLNYWNAYYKTHNRPFKNSDFAKFCRGCAIQGKTLIDIGCGNGRDSIYFSEHGLNVTGVDGSEVVIETLKKQNYKHCNFVCKDLNDFDVSEKFDSAYCRFLLHSISEETEEKLLIWLKEHINKYLFIENRSNYDKLSKMESTHYRRFFSMNDLLQKLMKLDFEILYSEISDNFSSYKKEYDVEENEKHPHLMRIVCQNG